MRIFGRVLLIANVIALPVVADLTYSRSMTVGGVVIMAVLLANIFFIARTERNARREINRITGVFD
jgi:hypothetical protein